MRNNRGFTLAEVLVTLSIIGVLSAIVLPTLMSSAPNKEQIMLKKAYYLLSRNVNELINDEELYPERDSVYDSGFSNVSIKDLTADKKEAKFHGREYSGSSKFCELMAARMNVKGNVNCSSQISLANGGNFVTADGIIWSLPYGNFKKGSADSTQQVYVDVSGNSGHNCFEGSNCKIPDRFTINVDRYGRITVPNGIEQEYLTRSTTNKSYYQLKKK